MISRLPRWVWLGGFILAFIAGMINAVGFLSFEHQAISHLTGTTTLLGISAAQLDLAQFLHLGSMLLSFFIGAAMSGFIIRDSALRLGRRYGVVLFIESIFLIAAVPLLSRNSGWGFYLAACACGLQNAMASTYSGSVIRTTHLSGMFTDVGILIGHFLRGVSVDLRRLTLYGIIIAGFFLGGILSAALFLRMSFAVLYIPAACTITSAFVYTFYRKQPPRD